MTLVTSCYKKLAMKLTVRAIAATLVFFLLVANVALAQTFTTLASFDSTKGSNPYYVSLVQGLDGNFYGTTSKDGGGFGTVFRVTPGGTITTLHVFCHTECSDGASPYSGLTLGTNGSFYGTTISGGTNNDGTVFKITPGGTLTTLYSFCHLCGEGYAPIAGLVQAGNGSFYGTTISGGANGVGTIFSITPGGVLTSLHSFDLRTDGGSPAGAKLVQATNGSLYGVTNAGGANGFGTVYKITPAGTLTLLHSFDFAVDGANLFNNGLVQASDGNFYGTTFTGSTNGQGSVFKMTPAGVVTMLYRFCAQPNCIDGAGPFAELVQGTNGNLYGSTAVGGAHDTGTIFKISPAGTLTTLYSLTTDDTEGPYGALLQSTNGTFYGTLRLGPGSHMGSFFSFFVGLGPFVKTLPGSAKVGAVIMILGTNLTGTTAVSFNGTAATFTVVSNSQIKATVPASATSGKVTVVTPGGTRQSNVAFRVTP
jgi:uncharacterized repeat protein (TIGR03803 family)